MAGLPDSIGATETVLVVLSARHAAAALEVAHDASVQERGDVRDVHVRELGRRLEAGRGEQALAGVDAVEDQRVEVEVQVEDAGEALRENDGARAAGGRMRRRARTEEPGIAAAG